MRWQRSSLSRATSQEATKRLAQLGHARACALFSFNRFGAAPFLLSEVCNRDVINKVCVSLININSSVSSLPGCRATMSKLHTGRKIRGFKSIAHNHPTVISSRSFRERRSERWYGFLPFVSAPFIVSVNLLWQSESYGAVTV